MERRTFSGGVPVNLFLPLDEIAPGALQQIITTSLHPYVVSSVAVMPDTHQGYGVAIGTVFRTRGVIVPNAVGVDIGCGVSALPLGVTFEEHPDASFWRDVETQLRELVPVGFNQHDAPVNDLLVGPDFLHRYRKEQRITAKAAHQLGTLGGGNHFLEYARDEATGEVYALVHSGSRGAGNLLARQHHEVAKALNRKKADHRDPQDLESLPIESDEGKAYLTDLQWGVTYAWNSRAIMLRQMRAAFYQVAYGDERLNALRAFRPHDDTIIGLSHNYAEISPDGIVIHRKGACFAGLDVMNVIPGSMGSPSYLVSGLGNPESLESSSHGAGRVIGRKAAQRGLTVDAFAAALDGTFSTATAGTLDESPMAYKDIDVVIERQSSCVNVVRKLQPILTVKGGGRDEG